MSKNVEMNDKDWKNYHKRNYGDISLFKLIEKYKALDEAIHSPHACYGSKDVQHFYGIETELHIRGCTTYDKVEIILPDPDLEDDEDV